MNETDSIWNDDSDPGSLPSAVSRPGSVASDTNRGSVVSQRSSRGTGSVATGTRTKGARLDATESDAHFCTFRLGSELFAIDVGAVGEVFTIERMVRVPMAPPGILGLTNLRGSALAVVDLGAILKIEVERRPDGDNGMVALVLGLGGIRAAAAIDAVESVFPVDANAVRESDAINEHPAIAGFLDLPGNRTANVLDIVELKERIGALRMFESSPQPTDES